MAALCEAFTLCGLVAGPGQGVLGLEPAPGADQVLLTDRGRTATLYKVAARRRVPRGRPRPRRPVRVCGLVCAVKGRCGPPCVCKPREQGAVTRPAVCPSVRGVAHEPLTLTAFKR